MPLRHTANQALSARATTTQPHHLGIGGGLVDEDQSSGIKHALFSHPAPARPRHVRALLLCHGRFAQRVTSELRLQNGSRKLTVKYGADRMSINDETAQLRHWLFEVALPLWWRLGADRVHGGF